MLGWLGFEFPCCSQIGYVGQVHVDGILSQFPPQLSDGFHEWSTLDVADGSANFCDDEIVVVLFSQQFDVSLNLVGDVWYHLNGFSQIVSVALFVDDSFVDSSCCQRVGLGSLNACEPFDQIL